MSTGEWQRASELFHVAPSNSGKQQMLRNGCLAEASITRTVAAKALRAQLLASTVVVSFATCVVHARGQASEPHTQDVSLTSNVTRQLSLQIGAPSTDRQDGAKGVFTVEPRDAVLEAVRLLTQH